RLKDSFGNYLKGCMHQIVDMNGSYDDFIQIAIVMDDIGVKFGEGWRRCYRKCKFIIGDVIRFECKDLEESDVIYVAKVRRVYDNEWRRQFMCYNL
ncbi:hypothetical protein A2U01_0025382, partial [Trifolium medium]|nr:hypothetical protein [Trifolium medium]